jgi:allophanate hydrolase
MTTTKGGQVSATDGRRGELFRISEAGLGRSVAALRAPVALTLANIELDDGRTVIGVSATEVT